MTSISIHQFLARVDLKHIAFIESLSSGHGVGAFWQNDCSFTSLITFISGQVLLTQQPLDYFKALAHGRVLEIKTSTTEEEGEDKIRLIPLDAIHHLELSKPDDQQTDEMGVRSDSTPARIVYHLYDPANLTQRFRVPLPVAVIDALIDRDHGALIDIGGGKFVFADAVEDARPLEAWQIAEFAKQQKAEETAPDEPPVSIVSLKDGAFVPSSFLAGTIEGMVQRPLPSASIRRVKRRRCFEQDLYKDEGSVLCEMR